MNLTDIEDFLDRGLKIVQQASSLASIGGPTAGAWGAVVGHVAGVADSLLLGVEGDAAIIGSGDLTKIRALQQSLQAENAQLAAKVDAS